MALVNILFINYRSSLFIIFQAPPQLLPQCEWLTMTYNENFFTRTYTSSTHLRIVFKTFYPHSKNSFQFMQRANCLLSVSVYVSHLCVHNLPAILFHLHILISTENLYRHPVLSSLHAFHRCQTLNSSIHHQKCKSTKRKTEVGLTRIIDENLV